MQQSKIYTLKNGLKLIFYQDNSKHSTYAKLIVNYGGMNNEFTLNGKQYHIQEGMAHFLEHLLIEHSMYGNIIYYFRNNHVRSNGSTSIRFTDFYIKTVDNFLENLEKLIKIVNIPSFKNEDIEAVKPAIYEEIRKTKDNKFRRLAMLDKKCLFKNYSCNVIGEIEDIEKIDFATAKMCYDVFYQPQNQVIAIAGAVDIEKTIEFIEKVYDEIDKKKIDYKLPEIKEPSNVSRLSDSIVDNVNQNFVRISYKIPVSSLTPFERVKLDFYISYFLHYNFSETSQAYKKLIEEKISVSNISINCYFFKDFLIVSLSTYTDKKDEFIRLIQDNMMNKNTDINDFELRRKETIFNLILREEKFISVITAYMDNILTYNYYEVDKIEDIEEQTYEDFIAYISSLDFSNYCITEIRKKS